MKKLAKKKKVRARRQELQHKLFSVVINKLPKTWDGLKELGAEADVSAVSLYHWREGVVSSPRINGVLRVAEALGLQINIVDPAKVRLKPVALRRVS